MIQPPSTVGSSVQAEQEPITIKFGIHNSSGLDAPDPAEAFEAVKAKAQWAEESVRCPRPAT
jgi:hypothetical protein